MVKALVEALLLGQEDDRAIVLLQTTLLTGLIHCSFDVTPDVWSIVPVKVDNRLRCCVARLTESLFITFIDSRF